MSKYLVRDGHKHHNGKEYAPGAVIECDDDTAMRLRLEPAPEDKKPVPAGKKADK